MGKIREIWGGEWANQRRGLVRKSLGGKWFGVVGGWLAEVGSGWQWLAVVGSGFKSEVGGWWCSVGGCINTVPAFSGADDRPTSNYTQWQWDMPPKDYLMMPSDILLFAFASALL